MPGSIELSPFRQHQSGKRQSSIFEPIHGSAPDIAGKGIAHTAGTFWAIAMMLEHLKMPECAAKLMDSVCAVLRKGRFLPPDLCGSASTTEMTDAVIRIHRG